MSKTTELLDKLHKLKQLHAEAIANVIKYKGLAAGLAEEIEQVTQELST